MKAVSEFDKIYLHKGPVDGRKQINGLAAIVQGSMGHNPFNEGLFVFTTRRKNTIKLLYWNKTGFSLWMHRLEEERFHWPKKMEEDVVSLSPQQLEWLLAGYDILRMKPHAKLAYASVC